MTVRPVGADDRDSLELLAGEVIAGSPYADMMLPALESALGGGTREARAVVAVTGGERLGMVVFGEVAGTSGTARLHLVAVAPKARRTGVARALMDAAAAELARDGGRALMAELPDDPGLAAARECLLHSGFDEDARVPDFYRDGVALVILRRRLGDASPR